MGHSDVTKAKHYRSLDGLRGVAALVVVIYHSMIATPRFGEIRLEPGVHELSMMELLISSTPFRIFWSGTEAVIVFFVLSGLVLSIPFARGDTYPTVYFYPRRLLRLYLPAIASLVLAYILALAVPRVFISGASAWVNEHAELPNGAQQVLVGSSLMVGWGGLNLSLWSLRWEVLFSMLLALFLWMARFAKNTLWLKVTATAIVAVAWPLSGALFPNAVFIVVFVFGALMAFHLEWMEKVASKMSLASWLSLIFVAAALISYSGTIAAWNPSNLGLLLNLWVGLACVGAVFIVFAAIHWRPFVGWLESSLVQWLGKVSFSLYLIQDPVIVTLAILSGGKANVWLVAPAGILLCLGIAYLFYRLVERPSHLLSRGFLRGVEQRRAANNNSVASP